MSKTHLLFGPILASLLLAATVCAESQTTGRQANSSSRRVQTAAPVINRRASLPAGWFSQGQQPAALTETKGEEAQPAAHFDTTGEEGSADRSQVSRRLRQIRRSVVFEDLQPVRDQGNSSRKVKARTIPLPATPREPIEQQTAAGAKAASEPEFEPKALVATKPIAPAREADELPAFEATQQLPDAPAGEASDPRTEIQAQTASDKFGSAPNSTNVRPADSEPARAAVDVNSLPSVMRRPSARENMSQGASARVASERDGPDNPIRKQAISDQADNLTATPMVEQPIVEPTDDLTEGDPVLTAHKSPVLSVTTRGPRTVVVGKSARFVVDIENSSQVDARDVVVRLNIPHWVEVVEHNTTVGSPRIEPDEQGDATLAWSINLLEGNAVEKLTLEIIPRGSRPLDLGVTWSFMPAHSTAQIQVQEPKLELSVVGPQDVLFGETKVYTITVSNPGTGDADNVVLTLLPLIPGERTAGVRQLGTIRAGTRRTLDVELTARQTGRLQVRAEAAADGSLRAQGVQEVLVRRAALEVAIDGPPMKYAGTRARYTIRVSNTGDATARDVVAIATLPAGSRNVASSAGGRLDANHGQVQWRVGSIRPNATRVLELECALISPGSNRLDLRTVAEGDVNALGSTVTNVESLADLKMTVNDPKGAVAVGADVAYEIRIENRGTKAAGDIQLYGYFSDGIEPKAIRGWRGSVSEGEVVMERIPRLGPGQEMVVNISAAAQRPGDHVFRAELECLDPETKLAVEEWTRFFGESTAVQQTDQREATVTAQPTQEQSR